MSRNTLRNLIVAGAIALGTSARVASAVPINGRFVNDPRCDQLPTQLLTHELGVTPPFPSNESIVDQPIPVTFTVCVPNDGIPNDWVVDLFNASGQAWKDLYFVCNLGATVGNADGLMEDLTGAPGVFTDTFKIDGTVTFGVNNNLLSETGGPTNEIFEPGEVWRFAVSNFIPVPGAVGVPPNFRTPGVFAGSSPIDAVGNNASIVAVPVPEPATISVVLLGAAALLMRRPGRA
jgi:hypothetical protein